MTNLNDYFTWMADTVDRLDSSMSSTEALLQARHFVESFPGYELPETFLADILLAQGKASEAIERISKATVRDNHSGLLQASKISLLLSLGENENARNSWLRSIELMEKLDDLLVATVARALSNNQISFAEFAVESFPAEKKLSSISFAYVEALVAAQLKNSEKAMRLLRSTDAQHRIQPLISIVAWAQCFSNECSLQNAQLFCESLVRRRVDISHHIRPLAIRLINSTALQLSEMQSQPGILSFIASTWDYGVALKGIITELESRKLYAQGIFQAGRLSSIASNEVYGNIQLANLALLSHSPNDTLRYLDALPSGAVQEVNVVALRARALLELGKASELADLLNSPQAGELVKTSEVLPLLQGLLGLKRADLVAALLPIIPQPEKNIVQYNTIAVRALSRIGNNIAEPLLNQLSPEDPNYQFLKLLNSEFSATPESKEEAKDIVASIIERYPCDGTAHMAGAESLFALDMFDEGFARLANVKNSLSIPAIDTVIQRPSFKQIPRRNKTVVFMASIFRTRFAKMARSLKRAGWNSVLITREHQAPVPPDCFDEVHRIDDYGRILSLIASYRPTVCHIGSWMGDDLALTIMRAKFTKTVIDPTDYGSGFITFTGCALDELYQNECIRLADGICARDTRPRLMWRELGVKRPSRVIHFPDYCWNEEGYSFLSKERLDGIHVASAGGLVCQDTPENLDYGYCELARALEAAKVHFHVYPSEASARAATFERDYGALIKLSHECEYLHVWDAVRTEQVPEVLSRYHFGIHFYLPPLNNRALKGFTYPSMYMSGPARFADYLDAGLILLGEAPLLYSKALFERRGVYTPIDLSFLQNSRAILEQKLEEISFEEVGEFRARFSTDAHVHRLIKFYESL